MDVIWQHSSMVKKETYLKFNIVMQTKANMLTSLDDSGKSLHA